MKHRYAAHYVHVPGRGYVRLQGVEVEEGRVVRLFPLEGETSRTEWLPGVLTIDEEGRLYHEYPFDFTAMQPASGTLRIPLL